MPTDDFTFALFGANYHDRVELASTDEEAGGLELYVNRNNESVTVVLNEVQVRTLRLALQRFERGSKG